MSKKIQIDVAVAGETLKRWDNFAGIALKELLRAEMAVAGSMMPGPGPTEEDLACRVAKIANAAIAETPTTIKIIDIGE